MSRTAHCHRQPSSPSFATRSRLRPLTCAGVSLLGLLFHAAAQAASARAPFQVKVQVASSCRIAPETVQNLAGRSAGRIDCPALGGASASSSGAPHTGSVSYTLSESPGSAGGEKTLTLNY